MDLKQFEEKLQKSLDVLIDDLSKIHAGRVSPTQLKPIIVQTENGGRQGVMELALVRVVNQKALAVKPWDAAELPHIEKAIRAANLGVNPVISDGEVHVVFPDLTQDRRKELAKSVSTYGVNTKNALRSVRHDYLKENKKSSKEEEVKQEKDIQKIMDKFNNMIDDYIAKKQKDIVQM